MPLSGKFLIADAVEIQKKYVITYATFSLITITRKLRRNYGVITDAVITGFVTLEPWAMIAALVWRCR